MTADRPADGAPSPQQAMAKLRRYVEALPDLLPGYQLTFGDITLGDLRAIVAADSERVSSLRAVERERDAATQESDALIEAWARTKQRVRAEALEEAAKVCDRLAAEYRADEKLDPQACNFLEIEIAEGCAACIRLLVDERQRPLAERFKSWMAGWLGRSPGAATTESEGTTDDR